ncbi:GDP-mannose 4,6-dehydratase [Chloroflexota bacterium]
MKVLITGITGFVGSHLAEFCLKNGIEVFGTKRWRSPLNNIKSISTQINLIDCDLRDENSIASVINMVKPDRVFHLAAQSYVPTSFSAPRDTFETNIIGTLNLLEAIKQSDLDPLIHICSSSEVYGQVYENEIPINENNQLRPQSPYAVSKVGEDLVAYQYYKSYGLKTIRTRAFTHTGPRRGSVFVCSAFAKQIAEIESGRTNPILYVGNLDSVRTFLDVRDIVHAYWLTLEKCTIGDVYNIGGSITMTIREMLDILLAMSTMSNSIEVEVSKELLRHSDVTLQIPSIEKFRKATSWQPQIPFKKTLEDLLNYWRENI